MTMGTLGAGALAFMAWKSAELLGSRIGVFVCFAVLSLVVIDAVFSLVAAGRVRTSAAVHPTDVVVGDQARLAVSIRGPRVPLQTFAGAIVPPAEVATTSTLERRGIVHAIDFTITSHGLAHLAGCARQEHLVLKRPLAVGPRPVAPGEPFPELFGPWGEGAQRAAATGDVVRSVREYVQGDPLRRVHWPATARRGQLVVKEVDEPGAPRLLLALDLGSGGPEGEEAAGRAAWYAREALNRGYAVVLSTAEQGGPVTGLVSTLSALNWRLAAAVPGRPGLPAIRGRAEQVLHITDKGDHWG